MEILIFDILGNTLFFQKKPGGGPRKGKFKDRTVCIFLKIGLPGKQVPFLWILGIVVRFITMLRALINTLIG
jgi:hypothetical protein